MAPNGCGTGDDCIPCTVGSSPAQLVRSDGSLYICQDTNPDRYVLISFGGGSGSVSSVGMTAPSFLNVAGSPITSSGTLALTLASQNQNLFMASPNTGAPGEASGGAAEGETE